jgi:hypothetical protein
VQEKLMDMFTTLPTWVIYSAVGACLGALGAAASWLLQGTGQKWPRFLPIAAIALSGTVTKEFVLPHVQNARLESELAEFGWIRTLKVELPEEYDRIAADMRAASTSATSVADAKQKGLEIMTNFRRRYASALAKAPDDQLMNYMQAWLVVLKSVQSTGGPTLCAEFARSGATALEDHGVFRNQLDDAVSLMIVAAASALRNPQAVETATEDDWAAFAAKLVDSGGTLEDVQLLESEDYSSPSYCQATVRFLQAVVDIPDQAGHRIRAEVAKGMAEG